MPHRDLLKERQGGVRERGKVSGYAGPPGGSGFCCVFLAQSAEDLFEPQN